MPQVRFQATAARNGAPAADFCAKDTVMLERFDSTRQRNGTDSGAPGADDPRVYLAAERTLLAWIRTSLALMGLGFLAAKFGLFLREMAAYVLVL